MDADHADTQTLRQLKALNRIARIALEDLELRPMLQRVVDTLHQEFGWDFIACASVDAARGEFCCEALHTNLLPRGIRVNVVAPGPVWTPFNPADKPADEVAEFGMDSAMGRSTQPEELSPAFVFLASPVTASYVNGIVLPVLGGPKG